MCDVVIFGNFKNVFAIFFFPKFVSVPAHRVKLSADGALKVKVSSDDMLRLPSPYVLRVIDSKHPHCKHCEICLSAGLILTVLDVLVCV